jgi:carbon-monoxide dehydrogenase large subunit
LGTHNHGQGHETASRQIAAQTFGVTADQLQVLYGDTDLIAHGRGTFGSRSMSSGGTALLAAADKVITKAKRIAAHRLEAAADDVEFNHGVFGIAGTDRRLSWQEVAAAAYAPATLPAGMEPGLNEAATVTAKGPTFPNCAHVSEIEIDPETGEVHVVGYWTVDDVGRVINPLLLHGQIQGGVVQGIGQALMEDLRYEADGQLVTASFMDYAMPRASDSPTVTLESRPVPTKMNPLGAKGAGEAGTVGALPATINAIIDALRPLGIADIPMPATPERIWRAIHEQRPD